MMKKLLLVSFVALVSCSSLSPIPQPGNSLARGVEMVTEPVGELGAALVKLPQASVEVNQDDTGFANGLVYVGVEKTSVKELEHNAVFQAALKDHRAVLVERSASESPDALGNITDTYFNFKGPGQAYVFRTLPETDGGVSVYPINMDNLTSSVDTLSDVNPAVRSNETLDSVLSIAGMARSTSNSTDDTEVQNTLSTAGVPTTFGRTWPTPPGVAQYPSGGILKWDYITPIEQKKAHAPCFYISPCTYYRYSKLRNRAQGSSYLQNVTWWGDWIICGGVKVDENNFCATTYGGTKMTTTAKEESISYGGTIGWEVGGEVSLLGLLKISAKTRIEGTIAFGTTWSTSESWTFTNLYSSTVKEGYRARFGRGDYHMQYDVVAAGAHKKYNQFFDTTNDTLIALFRWYPDFRSVVARGEAVTFGAMHWAICKNADMRCFARYNQSTPAELKALFPL